jgi:chromosome transmission fidelity protein 18
MVRKATVGMKETESSTLEVLNNLFSPMPKKRCNELGLGEEEESRYVGRLSREVDATGSIDRVAIGTVLFFFHSP